MVVLAPPTAAAHNGYLSVDVPTPLLPRMGHLLGAFEDWLLARRPGAPMRREAKEPGNHVTPWWLYARGLECSDIIAAGCLPRDSSRNVFRLTLAR